MLGCAGKKGEAAHSCQPAARDPALPVEHRSGGGLMETRAPAEGPQLAWSKWRKDRVCLIV